MNDVDLIRNISWSISINIYMRSILNTLKSLISIDFLAQKVNINLESGTMSVHHLVYPVPHIHYKTFSLNLTTLMTFESLKLAVGQGLLEL